jgi:hypothetical protein
MRQKPKTQSFVHAGGICEYLELMCRSKANLTPELANLHAVGSATLQAAGASGSGGKNSAANTDVGVVVVAVVVVVAWWGRGPATFSKRL